MKDFMKDLYACSVTAAFGLVLGNFIFQLFVEDVPDWTLAAERSYFQVIAIALVVGLMKLSSRNKQ
jgi:hypothetical protein